MTNHGLLIEKEVNAKDYRFGSVTGLEPVELVPNGDWTMFLPTYEPQANSYFDSMSCVTFAALNCLEAIIKRTEDREVNFSDRFTAIHSGTTQQGNYMSTVAECIRMHGLLLEEDYPFASKSWEEYSKPIPEELSKRAGGWLIMHKIGWEWCGTDKETLKKVLKTSPVSVSVQTGSPTNNKGYYVNREGSYGHVIMLYNVTDEYYECYDHYYNKYKKYDITYKFGSAMRWSLTDKTPMKTNPLNFKNNTLVNVIEKKRQFQVLYLDGNFIVDDEQKIERQWRFRNVKDGYFSGGPARTISREDFDVKNSDGSYAYPAVLLNGKRIKVRDDEQLN